MRTRVMNIGVAGAVALGLVTPPADPALHVPGGFAAARAAMAAAGPPYAGWAAAGRTFLLFDPAGDGFAAEVLGDLATADRIAVLVPGVGTTLADFDRGLGGVARRAPAVQARHVYDALREQAPQQRVAVVAWLGYDPPGGWGLAVATEDRALTGAAALNRFVRGLTAQRPAATVTLIGHSYGSVVLGLAAPRLPAQVTDLVALGSPGMGVDRAADLGSSARVWAGQAAGDWIRRVPGVRVLGLGHGRHPADPEFGARPLPTDGVDGHDGYLQPGSPTLGAVAALILGS